ncbi:Crp/Fnr family transcriptional regulator [Flavobacterium foetidum]|uniref:Crp/Fnr family transcriptional regulator n=1 Tax=Flavobacterium foetidum TaxID=2026681 RepID=UPI001FC95D9C|nr:Crp/Fnr family transcriptional regulator [Flavobacterium foetidum]
MKNKFIPYKNHDMYNLLRQNIERKIPLTDEEWDIIVSKAELIKLKKNQFLQIQNSNSSYEGFILKGSFKTYILNENGTETVIFFSFENEWICDLESFYHQKPTTYNIKAIEDSEIVVISKKQKAYLFAVIPKLIKFHVLMIERANVAIQQRLLDVLNKTSKQRYLDFKERYPQKISSINNKNLSSYLGVSHEFLSKIKRTVS